MTSSNNYTEKNSLYGITEETFDEAHLKVDDIKWLDEEDENLSVDDIKWKEVDEEKRQVKGNDTASKGSFISVSDAIAYGSNGKNGKKGNGGRSGEKPPEHTDPDYFPVDIFPDWIREFIEEHKRIKGFPEQYTAAGVLAALSLACGNNRYIEEPFISKAALWIALVGRPGANKTHPLNAALAPFKEIDEKSMLTRGSNQHSVIPGREEISQQLMHGNVSNKMIDFRNENKLLSDNGIKV